MARGSSRFWAEIDLGVPLQRGEGGTGVEVDTGRSCCNLYASTFTLYPLTIHRLGVWRTSSSTGNLADCPSTQEDRHGRVGCRAAKRRWPGVLCSSCHFAHHWAVNGLRSPLPGEGPVPVVPPGKGDPRELRGEQGGIDYIPKSKLELIGCQGWIRIPPCHQSTR